MGWDERVLASAAIRVAGATGEPARPLQRRASGAFILADHPEFRCAGTAFDLVTPMTRSTALWNVR